MKSRKNLSPFIEVPTFDGEDALAIAMRIALLLDREVVVASYHNDQEVVVSPRGESDDRRKN